MANGPNGIGKGGKSFQDRELAAKVRTLSLQKMKDVLEGVGKLGKDINFQKAVILKLAGTVLPRLNEHSGEGGGEIPVGITITFKDGSPFPD